MITATQTQNTQTQDVKEQENMAQQFAALIQEDTTSDIKPCCVEITA